MPKNKVKNAAWLVIAMAERINGIPLFLGGNLEHTTDFKVRPGQTLCGTVLEVHADKALLLLQGLNVIAELETGVVPGERLALRVEEFRPDGKILLKIMDSGENMQDISRQELDTVLQHFGLEKGALNRTIVTRILRHNLPVSEQHLHYLTSFASTQNLSPEQVPALIWLWSKNLPLTGNTVAAIHNLMENGPDKSSLQNLFDLFSWYLTGKNAGTGDQQIFKNGENMENILKNLLVNSNDPPETAANKFRSLLERLGLDHERALLQLTESKNFSNSNFVARTPAEENNMETSLKHALLKHLQSPGVKPAGAQGETIRKILGEITGLQLLNISGQQETAESSSIFLANGVVFPEEKLLPLFLKIKEFKQHGGEIENPLYQIFFLLHTRRLGQVICRLALEKERLTCGFTVKGKGEKNLIDRYMGFLGQRLERLPWKIVIFPTRVDSVEDIKRTWQQEFFASSPGKVKILDAQA